MQLLLGDLPFFSSGFRTTFLRQGEFGANTPLHLTKWDFGGGMMATGDHGKYIPQVFSGGLGPSVCSGIGMERKAVD